MRSDRNLAIILRKQNKSYNEIYRELGIPKSTLSYWFSSNQYSSEIKKNLIQKIRPIQHLRVRQMIKSNRAKWDNWHLECQDEAKREFPRLRNMPLFVGGLMLYWGEGDKVLKNGIVRICNSDPGMLRVYYAFLKQILLVQPEKIIVRLTLYPDLETDLHMTLWSKMLEIPLSQFRKPATIIGKHPERRLSYGVCSIEVYSRKLKEKILTWVKLYEESFSHKTVSVL